MLKSVIGVASLPSSLIRTFKIAYAFSSVIIGVTRYFGLVGTFVGHVLELTSGDE